MPKKKIQWKNQSHMNSSGNIPTSRNDKIKQIQKKNCGKIGLKQCKIIRNWTKIIIMMKIIQKDEFV